MEIRKEIKVIAFIEIITAIGLLLSWLLYYILDDTPSFFLFNNLAIEKGLLFLDTLFAGVLLLAGTQLLKGRQLGKNISFGCAAYMVFLGITNYNINFQGVPHALSMIDMVSKGFINLWCIILGIFIFLKLKDQGRLKN